MATLGQLPIIKQTSKQNQKPDMKVLLPTKKSPAPFSVLFLLDHQSWGLANVKTVDKEQQKEMLRTANS